MGVRRLFAGTAAGLVLLVALGYPVYVDPSRDRADRRDPADAVVVLGGIPVTATYGAELLRRGVTTRLVISNAYPAGYPTMRTLCPAQPPPGVTCFVPDPFTTRGEAREIGRLATANGWDDVIVIAPTFQISRARVLIGRCYSGRLRMVAPERYRVPLHLWPYNYAYQTAGYLKVALLRTC